LRRSSSSQRVARLTARPRGGVKQEFDARAAERSVSCKSTNVYTNRWCRSTAGRASARVATLKQNLGKSGRTPFSSIPATSSHRRSPRAYFKGEHHDRGAQRAASISPPSATTSSTRRAMSLLQRNRHEATFQGVVSKVRRTSTGQPIGGAAPYLVKQVGAVKVGFIVCVCTPGDHGDR